nr:MAG TPA: hypothetical protein [Caudoviricetes sp.]
MEFFIKHKTLVPLVLLGVLEAIGLERNHVFQTISGSSLFKLTRAILTSTMLSQPHTYPEVTCKISKTQMAALC